MCYSLWYNAPTMLPTGNLEPKAVPPFPGYRRAKSWVHYTTSCNIQFSAPEDRQNNCPKYAGLIGIINKLLLLHLLGCLYWSCFLFVHVSYQVFVGYVLQGVH